MDDNIEKSQKQNLSVPIAIVIAGGFIALAIFFSRDTEYVPTKQQENQNRPNLTRADSIAQLIETIPVISQNDHTVGNPSAPLALIEYSDIECPFCKRFHTTVQQIMKKYGADGSLVWVYRHFPLSIHPKAYPEALASECVAALSGNVMFWNFLNNLMLGSAQIPDTLEVNDKITKTAELLKLDSRKIIECTNAGTYKNVIEKSEKEAIAGGLGQNDTGTPYTILIAKGKSSTRRLFIDGAQPYESVEKPIIEALKFMRE